MVEIQRKKSVKIKNKSELLSDPWSLFLGTCFLCHCLIAMDPKMKVVLFLAGRRLPDEEKIKLIDIIPGIGNYVKKLIINTEDDEAGISVCALVERLPNLRKVVTKTPIRHLQVLIKLAAINPRIIEFEGFFHEAILEYILRVKELDQNYHAGDVKKVFISGFDYLTSFFEKFPDANLKLRVCIGTPEYEDELVQNGRGHLIHDLELADGYNLRSEFRSVRNLIILESDLSSNLPLVPNVEEVRIDAPIGAEDPNMILSLLVIKNLRRLSLFSVVQLTEANFKAFQSILMKPSLKYLEFREKPDSELKFINAFLDCERNDFESLVIRVTGHGTIIRSSVVVKDQIITIYDPIDFSLVRLFSKFKRINKIIIEIVKEKFLEPIRDEIGLIVDTLPRNRSLCVEIDWDVIRY